MNKLWGVNTATGDEVLSQAHGDDDCCQIPQSIAHVDVENLGDDLSTSSSSNRVTTPLQEAGSTGHAASSKQGSFSTNKGCKRKKNSKADSTPPEIQDLCHGLKSAIAERRSYYVTKQTTSEEQRAYFASKKVYYEKLTTQLDNYDKCVQALLELNINESYPHFYYFTIELFASRDQRSLFLAIPQHSRFGYIERLYNKSNGFGPSG
ncbi:hypothetical protein HS088_TW04G01460 [Tripterygium wilfordii]|uniref:Uncharacterized protein n=2 Tax=Tripterygium wilfordii TaxID=458696 RepID=A0A7J7DT57_TRIWF|nr:hypothetical protein HS088_TW04G01460 [Tripterygium wilfordii]